MAENRPKPGSLRDRIAAFESQSKNKSSDSSPPPPRPKPAHLTREWKPHSRPEEDVEDKDKVKERSGGAMSASDAKESIHTGGFGSLKERMAALQGKGGFGGAGFGAPPPPPTVPKPLPKKIVPSASEGEAPQPSEEGETEEKPAVVNTSDAAEDSTAGAPQHEVIAEEKEENTEEDEHARRAAIAARMARLGGTRIGMAPPVFGRKPPPVPVKKASVDETDSKSPAESPLHSEERLDTIPKAETPGSPVEPPQFPSDASVNLLVGPKRAAPPRKKRTPPAPASVAEEVKPEVKPEEVALPPSRSTTLDVEQSTSVSPAEEDKKPESPKVASPQPTTRVPPLPLGHIRLQSIASESVACTEESATPPPRSTTPTTEDEDYVPAIEEMDQSDRDLPAHSEDVASPISHEEKQGLNAVPTSPHETTTPTQSSLTPTHIHGADLCESSRGNANDLMEDTHLTTAAPVQTRDQRAEQPHIEVRHVENGSEEDASHGRDQEALETGEDGELTESGAELEDLTRVDHHQPGADAISEEVYLTAEEHMHDEPHVEAPVHQGKAETGHVGTISQSPESSQENAEPVFVEQNEDAQDEEDEEVARRQRIAEKMKKLGGFNPFGPASGQRAPPPSRVVPPPPMEGDADSPTAATDPTDVHEEEEEARRRRIAQKMSKMGGFNPFGAPRPESLSADPPLPDIVPDERSNEEEIIETHKSFVERGIPTLEREEDSQDAATEPDTPPPPVPLRTYRRSIPIAIPAADPVLSSEGEAEEQEVEEEVQIPPPVPERSHRSVIPSHPPPEIDEEENIREEEEGEENDEEIPPPIPQRIHRPNFPPSRNADEHISPASDEASPDTPRQPPREEEAEIDPEYHDRVPTPVQRRTSFIDFSEDAEEDAETNEIEEETPPPPPPRRTSIPVPPAIPKAVRAPSPRRTSSPPSPPRRPPPNVPRGVSNRPHPFAPQPSEFNPASRHHVPQHSVMSISDLPHLTPSYEEPRFERYEPLSDEDEPEGSVADPIDPMLHPGSSGSKRRSSALDKQSARSSDKSATVETTPATTVAPAQPYSRASPPSSPTTVPNPPSDEEGDDEGSRRKTIAERMARLGGVKFGAAPPIPTTRRQLSIPTATRSEQMQDDGVPLSTEAENERRRAIASRLAGQGMLGRGVFGVPMPSTVSVSPQRQAEPDNTEQFTVPTDDIIEPEVLATTLKASEAMEAQERVSAISPSETQIPAIPPPLPPHRPSAPSPPERRIPSPPSHSPPLPPPPRSASSGLLTGSPTSASSSTGAAQAILSASSTFSESWEPSIPRLDFNFATSNPESQTQLSSHMSDASHLGGSDAVNGHQDSEKEDPASPLTREELEMLASTLGARIVQSAAQFHSNSPSKSKASSNGSGPQASSVSLAFVNKVLSSIINAHSPLPYRIPALSPAIASSLNTTRLAPYGYPIYTHSIPPTPPMITHTIIPGDIILFSSCHFQGRKGLQSYNIHVGSSSTSRARSSSGGSRSGTGESNGSSVFGIINDVEKRHLKVKVFLSTDGVTVENNGYRLEELKAGIVEIFRIPEASFVL